MLRLVTAIYSRCGVINICSLAPAMIRGTNPLFPDEFVHIASSISHKIFINPSVFDNNIRLKNGMYGEVMVTNMP